MLSLVHIKNRIVPTMKIRQIEYQTGFFQLLCKIRCSLNPKAQAVIKAQRQFRPESYFLEFFNRMLWNGGIAKTLCVAGILEYVNL